MTHEELYNIALHAAKGTAPAEFTSNQVNSAFVDGIRELAGTVNQFMKNRYDIYDIVIKVADEVLPQKVIAALGAFAEVQVVPLGQKALFRKKIGRNRAKSFLTQVGLSGVYETFRLDNETYEVGGHAVGGGATIDFARMLDGAESLAEVMDIITEGLADAVYVEVGRALQAAINDVKRPAANKHSDNKFDSAEMFKLMSTVRAYGNPVIFACPEFIGEMGADAIVPVPTSGNYGGVYSPDDIEAIHRTGYIKTFRGAPIVEMPNSFTDDKNVHTQLNPQYAYIMPGGAEKVVKVVLEGDTIIHDFQNRDSSMEVYAEKKIGCAIFVHNNWAIYQNTNIQDNSENQYGF